MNKYLLEIGLEELPYKFIPQAIEQLKNGFEKFFNTNEIEFDKVNVYATPRRLAVIVEGLSEKQPDITKIVKGPIKRVAYDENGNLTKAGEGFLKKNNILQNDCYVEDDYLQAKIEVKGKSVKELLSDNISSLVLKLQGPHFMRWSNFDEKFSRPIRWIVSIFNNEELKVKIVDIESSKFSRGHRFSKQNIEISHPDEYIEKMREGHVIVNQDERKSIIVNSAVSEAEKVGAKPSYSDDLLEEVTFLCEYPVAVVCDFDEKYLQIPEEVVVTVMASHQRYLALYKNGKLLNKFITVTNFIGNEFENIKAGNLRVIKARLDDAVFFFKEDTKKSLEAHLEGLKGITFQKGLGSVYDKTMRIVELSKNIASELGVTSLTIERTALLCKADLTTSLVFEFTELQGYIGADYARCSNEAEEVCQGIKEHYFPLNADSELAESIEGQVVGIADKIDTICAVFADGKKPTGSSDPLGVRRAALGILKTIITKKLNLNLEKLIDAAYSLLGFENDCRNEINDFFTQRLIILLSDSYKKDVLEACAGNVNPLSNLTDYIERVKVLSQLDCDSLLESANRVIRILKEPSMLSVDENLFQQDAESMLFKKIHAISENTDYKTYLQNLIDVNPAVEKFFEEVFIMDENPAIKNNRHALLTELKNKYEKLADFSKLQN